MPSILIINPNTSQATTAMMMDIARLTLPAGFDVVGKTARRSVPMILEAQQLLAAGTEVVEMGLDIPNGCIGAIVSAFGDPGMAALRATVNWPVSGLCEASYLKASSGGRRFGIATVTPGLVDILTQKTADLGVDHLFTGIQLTEGDPRVLAADPERLAEELGRAVERCLNDDKAETTIIGGGPLGGAAAALSKRFGAAVIEPIPTAVEQLLALHQRLMHGGRDKTLIA
jgi:allantoin racemase